MNQPFSPELYSEIDHFIAQLSLQLKLTKTLLLEN